MSHELRKTRGFVSESRENPVTHLFFMDDLKVYQETPKQLEGTMRKVLEVSEGIGMELGLKKCAVLYVRGGAVVRRGPLRLRTDTCIGGSGHL